MVTTSFDTKFISVGGFPKNDLLNEAAIYNESYIDKIILWLFFS